MKVYKNWRNLLERLRLLNRSIRGSLRNTSLTVKEDVVDVLRKSCEEMDIELIIGKVKFSII